METLWKKYEYLLSRFSLEKKRYLYGQIDWDNRLIGIKGARGTGKTTLLLQRLKEMSLSSREAAYFSLDDLYFSTHRLVDTAELFYRQGGRYLFLDEVHKYAGWSAHIKNLYDFYPDLHIVFTGSSIIDIAREEADLSRRVLMHELTGLSYREYLYFNDMGTFSPVTLEEILHPERPWRQHFPADFRPLQYFPDYLRYGYYPFATEDIPGFTTRMQQLIRIIVEYDMAALHDFDVRNARKMLQLLYVLAANVPFKPNITSLAEKSNIHRNTVGNYLHFLEQAKLIRQLYPPGISLAVLQKPEKIYLDNTSLAFAIHTDQPDKGNLRETFFAAQVAAGHTLHYAQKGDFLVNNKWTFEIGGKHKTQKQIQGVPDSYIVADDTDYPVSVLPLWLFGFLY